MNQSLPPLQPGTLYLVATPIGNLEDITLRALRTLKECDLVAAEDTRRSGQLLKHFGISRPLLSYFQFNEAKRSEEIIERLRRGEKVALVTDAGSPGISDPGERVVKAAIAAGFRVESVPGPSALVAALTASGLPAEEFHFIGFLPHKSGQRRRELERLKTIRGTLVFYESPYRIEKLLVELNDIYPGRQVVLARELTKKFEQFLRGTPAELLEVLQQRALKGEFVVMVAGAAEDTRGVAADGAVVDVERRQPHVGMARAEDERGNRVAGEPLLHVPGDGHQHAAEDAVPADEGLEFAALGVGAATLANEVLRGEAVFGELGPHFRHALIGGERQVRERLVRNEHDEPALGRGGGGRPRQELVPPAVVDLDEALLGQQTQRSPDGRATHLQELAEAALAGQELRPRVARDGLAEGVGRLRGQGQTLGQIEDSAVTGHGMLPAEERIWWRRPMLIAGAGRLRRRAHAPRTARFRR